MHDNRSSAPPRTLPLSRRPAAAVLVGALLSATAVAVAPAASAAPVPELSWAPCPAEYEIDPATSSCTSVPVPRDYANPDAGTIDVMVTRHAATDPGARRGVLFTNPGGPGGDAIGSNAMIAQALPSEVRSEWDVVGVQPRGLPHAGPLDCAAGDELALATAVGFGGGATRAACEASAPGSTSHLTTENTARDWDVVRQALGEDTIDVYGLSYGTILGSTYATLFPQHTGRMVLDSAADQNWLWNDVLWHQNDGYKGRFYDLMDWIAAHDDVYGLGTTPLAVYQRWSDRIVEEAGGNPTIAPPPAQIGDVPPGLEAVADAYRAGVDLTGPARVRFEAFVRMLANPEHIQLSSSVYALTRQLLPGRNNWPTLARAVRDGELPEGASPADMSEAELDAVAQAQTMQSLILCNENIVAPRPDRLPGWLFSTFLQGDLFDMIGYTYSSGVWCAGAPPVTALPPLTGAALDDAPLVLQSLRDPQTPYDGGVRLAEQMSAHLVTVGGGDHGTAIQGGNTVVDTAITEYLRTGSTAITEAPEAPISAPL
ncbi:alpha/beta hydrolase [Rhodococcus rhodnii]|uniref:Proteinase n=2 Tax=Rhodococcus rhodnii TaxID=38312 RepID=R7WLU0_9NOCA|nr:alpha/beta hydrolase [Rhodococcus rhodnii]EOM76286.1 proteinase [Rhodococcus rhodnii LMG 5362]TXG90753.1 alpha/beta hydrolase [Rhodococcus rhodnii]